MCVQDSEQSLVHSSPMRMFAAVITMCTFLKEGFDFPGVGDRDWDRDREQGD